MACTVKQAIAKVATLKRAPSKGKAGKAPLRRNRTGRKLLAMGAKEVKAAKAPTKKPAPAVKAAKPPVKKPRRTPGRDSPEQKAADKRGKVTKGGTYPVYKKAGVQAQSFRKAFAAARKAGKKTFFWEHRKYNTKRAAA